MWSEWLQGGVGLAGIATAIKILWPLFKSRVDADVARAGADAKMHELYTEAITEMHRLSTELGKAQAHISRLEAKIEQLTEALNESRTHCRKSGESHVH